MKGAAIYARVSHAADQELGGQVRDLEHEVERRGLLLISRYVEKVSATGRTYREEYGNLLRDAADPARRFEHLFVWSLDRFSREETFTRATQTILDLEKLGVKFHSLKEPMLDTPADGVSNLGRDVLLALLPVIASYESRRRSERTRLAMRELKEGRRQTRSGRPVGRPRRVTPEAVSRAGVLRGQGFSWSAIAQRVGLPSGTLRAACHKARKAASDVL